MSARRIFPTDADKMVADFQVPPRLTPKPAHPRVVVRVLRHGHHDGQKSDAATGQIVEIERKPTAPQRHQNEEQRPIKWS